MRANTANLYSIRYLEPISYDKLAKIFAERKITMSEASRQIGRSDGYLQGLKYTGQTNVGTLKVLETVHGISYDMIKPDEPIAIKPDEPVADTTQEPTETMPQMPQDVALADSINHLNDVLVRMTEKLETFDAMLSDPMKLYKAIFVPMYNAMRTAVIDGTTDAQKKAKE